MRKEMLKEIADARAVTAQIRSVREAMTAANVAELNTCTLEYYEILAAFLEQTDETTIQKSSSHQTYCSFWFGTYWMHVGYDIPGVPGIGIVLQKSGQTAFIPAYNDPTAKSSVKFALALAQNFK